MDNPNQEIPTLLHSIQPEIPPQYTNNNSSLKILSIGLGVIGIGLIIGIGGYLLGTKRNQSPTSPTTKSSINFIDFTDNSKIFTLKVPENYLANGLSSYVTDSCTLFSDKSIINFDITASQAALLRQEGIFITACYSGEDFPDTVQNKIKDTQTSYQVISSSPFSINGYSGFKIEVKPDYGDYNIPEMVILKSPYGGYIKLSRETNGKDIFEKMLSSFQFIKQTQKRFSTEDQKNIRKMFADEYKKNITVTFGFPSPDGNLISGYVYLPQGQRCFHAQRTMDGWQIADISSTMIMVPECYKFMPQTTSN